MSKSTEDLIRELETGGVLGGTAGTPVKPARNEAQAVRRDKESSGLLYVLIAAVLVALLGSIPFGSDLLYPLGLFVTLVHETSHAIAATVTGGTVLSLDIRPDQSGITFTLGGSRVLTASAGYLGASLAGAVLLVTPLRYAKWALGAMAAFPLLALMFFHPASFFTGMWALGFVLALGLGVWKLRGRALEFAQIFIGVACGLNAFRDLSTLVFISGSNAHIHTDATNMSDVIPLPPTVWAVLWTVMSLVLLLGALVVVARREPRVEALLSRTRAIASRS